MGAKGPWGKQKNEKRPIPRVSTPVWSRRMAVGFRLAQAAGVAMMAVKSG